MIKILLSGCFGRMGKAVTEAAAESDGKFAVISGTDITGGESSFPIYNDIQLVNEKPDVIIDFSHHTALPAIIDYSLKNAVPTVIATTGHTEAEQNIMKDASEKIPVFFSRNMSLGVNLLISLCKKASDVLKLDFDVEIIEKHHHNKLDAPSGTALMIADSIEQSRQKFMAEKTEYVYDRHAERRKRTPEEIGIHSVRGGNIIGEHEVIFAGKNEVITLSHSASSRELFAAGALRAAEFIVTQKPGLYNMDELLNNII